MIHQAYSGIPTPIRNGLKKKTDALRPPEGESFYEDALPAGHDRLVPELVSGEIDVRITAATATVPGMQTDSGALAVSSRSGNPKGAQNWNDADIPVTTLKGVLASAYEAVTMSRFRIFGDHSHQITNRRSASEALTLYPVFLSYQEGKGYRVRVMLGDNDVPKKEEWKSVALPIVCEAFIPDSVKAGVAFYDDKGSELVFWGGKKKSCGDEEAARRRVERARELAPHMARIKVKLVKEGFFGNDRFIVKSIATQGGSQETLFDTKKGQSHRKGGGKDKSSDSYGSYEGVVVRTTPDDASEPLIDTKVNEFFFFDRFFDNPEKAQYIDVPDAEGGNPVIDSLAEVLNSYIVECRALKKREEGSQGVQSGTGTRTSKDPNNRLVSDILAARGDNVTRGEIKDYLREKAAEPNSMGIPLFAEISSSKKKNSPRVVSLTPTQVGRRAVGVPPHELAEQAGMLPSESLDECSPAERLWGFAHDDELGGREEDGQRRTSPGYRGHVTICPVVPVSGCDGLKRSGKGDQWVLNPLATPKPSSGAPYLRGLKGQTVDEASTRGEMFKKNMSLIRKAYPTHRGELSNKGLPSRAAVADDGEPGTQNTRLVSYLKPGAAFTTTIMFDNVTRQELAVLLWLLTPERLVPDGERSKFVSRSEHVVGYHRLGHGKPYGLGSVEIRATDVRFAENSDVATAYRSLSGCLGIFDGFHNGSLADLEVLKSFLEHLPKGFKDSLPVRAFQRASFGFVDKGGKPEDVTYPKSEGSGDLSPIIGWFSKRETSRVTRNQDINDPRYYIEPLADPESKE